ncbi:hypothetical protein [Pseudoxanthomonas putridarboris]|uniref:Secreted protein n=1 Tax=Pseudoxanthomonas putridarboris TaxID=752605 RepID=A0ABU9J3C9_9GAMM
MSQLKQTVSIASLCLATLFASPFTMAANPIVTPQVTCGSASSQVLQGGFVVSLTCDGKRISGIGTTMDTATSNANAIASLLQYDVRCSYSSYSGGPGAFVVSFGCSRPNSDGTTGRSSHVGGVGTTLTDAGNNIFGFAQLYAASNGYRCDSSETKVIPGGYITNFGCGYPSTSGGTGRASTIGGIGSTATDAAQNTLGFAELGASIDRKCSIVSAGIVGAAFEVRVSCSGRSVTGYGSTLTSAGRDALLQAQSL